MSAPHFAVKRVKPTVVEDHDILLKLREGAANAAIAYFQSKYKKDGALTDAPDGLYTWIISADGQLIAAQPISNQELGTLHNNLAVLNGIAPDNVYAAGELNKTGSNVTFNLQSGSFMQRVFEKGGAAALAPHIERAAEKFASIGLHPIFDESPMINATRIQTSAQNYANLSEFFEKNVTSPPKAARPSRKRAEPNSGRPNRTPSNPRLNLEGTALQFGGRRKTKKSRRARSHK